MQSYSQAVHSGRCNSTHDSWSVYLSLCQDDVAYLQIWQNTQWCNGTSWLHAGLEQQVYMNDKANWRWHHFIWCQRHFALASCEVSP